MVKTTSVSKGLTFKIFFIIVMVVVIAAIMLIFFMSQTGYLEIIAAKISEILGDAFQLP